MMPPGETFHVVRNFQQVAVFVPWDDREAVWNLLDKVAVGNSRWEDPAYMAAVQRLCKATGEGLAVAAQIATLLLKMKGLG